LTSLMILLPCFCFSAMTGSFVKLCCFLYEV
jgi:hypothetical protein